MCHHSMLLQAMQNHAVLNHCVKWHCDKPHSIALCQSTPRPTVLCYDEPHPKLPGCAITCQIPRHHAEPWQVQLRQVTLHTVMQDSAVPSHTRPHGTMQCPVVLPSTASHHTVYGTPSSSTV